MPLDEEEKRTLAKKLEEQRRAIWRGESVKSKGKKAERPNRFVSFENIQPDVQSDSNEEDEVEFTRVSPQIIEAEFTQELEDQQEETPEIPQEETVLELEIPQVGNQQRRNDAKIIPKSRASSPGQAEQPVAEETKSQAGVDLKWRPQDDETKQLVDKIRAQRQEVWVGESSPKRRKRLKRKTKKAEREFWNSESGESEKSPKKWLGWGGTFIVIFGAIAAILLGVLLGFLFANIG